MFTKSLLAAALVATASAHQNLRAVFINDASPGPYIGIRMPPSNSPVTDLTSTDMACNVPSTSGGAVKTLDAAAGDSIKVQWDQSGHPGPITHYVLPVKDAASATGAGAGWVKIDVGGKWASEIMGAANMTHEFKLPAGLASGEYLVRTLPQPFTPLHPTLANETTAPLRDAGPALLADARRRPVLHRVRAAQGHRHRVWHMRSVDFDSGRVQGQR
jgi:hypothetical protein